MESHSGSQFAGKRVHIIGIGGCGTAGLANILVDAGAIVTGSEPHPNAQTALLESRGVRITRKQRGELLEAAMDLVVRTAAVPDTNDEYRRALELGLVTRKYAELVGQVMRDRLSVAVAGAHGKTTTTSLVAYALTQCGADPGFLIGGTVAQLRGSSRSGRGPFVVEACEYDRSFHNLHPRIAVITNIDLEHVECYPDGLPEIIQAFHTFAARTPADGLIIARIDDPHVSAALHGVAAPIRWLTTDMRRPVPAGTWRLRVTGSQAGRFAGELVADGRTVAQLRPAVCGEHNLINASMALAACVACGVDAQAAAHALGRFTGVERRMTEVGSCNGATIVDDYGHHPTEIGKTLQALRQRYNPARLLCVFQPHQGARTRLLMDRFAAAFDCADQTIVPDIYYVRDSEVERQTTRAEHLVQRLCAAGRDAIHLPTFTQIDQYLRREARPGDLIVTMGAGNVWEVGHRLAGIRT